MLKKFYKFWLGKQDSITLDLFRVVFGILIFLSFACQWKEVSDYYSRDGFIANDYIKILYGPLRFSILDYIGNPIFVYAVYFLFLAIILLFTIGYKTKCMKILQFILIVSFHQRNFLILNSGDTLMRVMSFYFMISPCGKRLSIDSLLKKQNAMISIWAIRLMQFQLAAVYFFAGLAKYGTELWMDGTAVNFILRNSLFNRFSMEWITMFPYMITALTWISLSFELAFPLLIWFNKTRKILLLIGIFIHTGIFIFIDVGWFSLITIGCYIVFLKTEEAKNFVNYFKIKTRILLPL